MAKKVNEFSILQPLAKELGYKNADELKEALGKEEVGRGTRGAMGNIGGAGGAGTGFLGGREVGSGFGVGIKKRLAAGQGLGQAVSGGFGKFKFNKKDNFNKHKYQKWIDDFIKRQNKPIVFVGLNNMPWWHKNLYYEMHADYKFYIKIDPDTVFKQKCSRFIEQIFIDGKDRMFYDIKKNEEHTIDLVTKMYKQECSYKEVKKLNEKWNVDYKKQKYIFLPKEKIYSSVCEILESIIDLDKF
jgi:hypothetical protein